MTGYIRDEEGEQLAAKITAHYRAAGFHNFRIECDRMGVYWVQPGANGAILCTGSTPLEAAQRFAEQAAALVVSALEVTDSQVTGPALEALERRALELYRSRGSGAAVTERIAGHTVRATVSSAMINRGQATGDCTRTTWTFDGRRVAGAALRQLLADLQGVGK